MISKTYLNKILLSSLSSNVFHGERPEIIALLANQPKAIAIAQSFGSSKIIRQLKLSKKVANADLPEVDLRQDRVFYQAQEIGKIQILYKSSIPGELQARLAIESAIDRFLEYLQKVHQIVVLEESDRHVRVFIPNKEIPNFKTLWQKFLEDVAFSTFGENHLAGLVQTFVVMLNSINISRGFSTIDVPIFTKDQANILAALYLSVVRDVEDRQRVRQRQIDILNQELENLDISDKDLKLKTKDLQAKQEMQDKEREKYTEDFRDSYTKVFDTHISAWQKLETIEQELKLILKALEESNLPKAQTSKLQKQYTKKQQDQEKEREKLILSKKSIEEKMSLLEESRGDPFKFIRLDRERNPDKFRDIWAISKKFSKTATDQIASSKGAILAKCIRAMYQLLEMDDFDSLPSTLLSEHPFLSEWRSPSDESNMLCYSCGNVIDPKSKKFEAIRFIFQRPFQRRQSSASAASPRICSTCSSLSFICPLKTSEESIILKLTSVKGEKDSVSIKDYVRMLTNKEMHLSGGRYLVLASDRTGGGDVAAQKLGQVQYAMAKVVSIFPVEVLTDFNFSLVVQSSQAIKLESRHLLFIKGVMEGYSQSIIISGKDINITLGDAVRYIDQDLPILAEYTLTKIAVLYGQLELEKVREAYWVKFKNDLGDIMDSGKNTSERSRFDLYQDVAALTGLTYAFASYLESTLEKFLKEEAKKNPEKYSPEKIKDSVQREVGKLIENVNEATFFSYYAALGDETKTSVQARLYRSPYNYFIYDRTKSLLESLGLSDRETIDADKQQTYLSLYADDILSTYTYFAKSRYSQPKDWNDLTYQLKLSLYTRFPELVRKLKTKGDK